MMKITKYFLLSTTVCGGPDDCFGRYVYSTQEASKDVANDKNAKVNDKR